MGDTCNPIHAGGRDQEECGSRQKVRETPSLPSYWPWWCMSAVPVMEEAFSLRLTQAKMQVSI
jgi:hypothetical protein